MNIFSIDSPLSRFFHLAGDIITLHILWVVFSLPLITIGASTTALYYSCMKRIRTHEGYVARNFIKSFRENFRQSTIIWILMLVLSLLFVIDIRIGMNINTPLGTLILVSCSVLLLPCILTALYIFPVQAKFENRIYDNLKNALIMSLRHFLYSLLLLFIWGTLFLLTISFVPFMGLMLGCGAGIAAYLTSNIFIHIFRKYIPEELTDDLERSGYNNLHF